MEKFPTYEVDTDRPSEPPVAAGERRSSTVLRVVERIMWPVVKLLLHRGITYPVLEDTLKAIFVRVAMQEFPPQGRRETDSRISVLTGIYRRDVKRLREEYEHTRVNGIARQSGDPAGSGEPVAADETGSSGDAEISLASMVIATWTGDPEYLDADGRPRPLPRLERKGGRLSFESLVRSISKDVRSRAVLDEWIRRGAVTLNGEDNVELNLDVFMANKRMDEKAFFFGQNVHDHIAATAHNLAGQGPPFLERCVYYGGLTAESVAELSDLSREEAMRALHAVNSRAIALSKRDAESPSAIHRINFGAYFFSAAARIRSGLTGRRN